MQIIIQKTIEIPIDKQIKRVNDLFKGKQRQRLLAVLNAFKKGEFRKAYDLADKLPRDTKLECPEQEFLPLFLSDFAMEVRTLFEDKNPFGNMAIKEVKVISVKE